MFLKKEFSAEQIYFEDDNLTFDMNWAKRLFSEIGRLGLELEIFLRNGIRADRVDSELLELMKKAGVNRVWFSPESGSQRILDQVIQKKMKLEDCENAIRLARKAGLNVTCFFIIGFPQETLEDVRQTLRYAEKLKKMGCDSVWISCATPYPGTELFLDCIRRGIISAEHLDYQSLSTLDSIISNEWFSAGQIKQIRDRAMREMNSKSLADVTRLIRKRVEMLFRNPVLFFRIGFWRAVHAIRKKVIHV
jgi:magnesium-protoporphyrin IX monomethyl ester (oxidative) cyclase